VPGEKSEHRRVSVAVCGAAFTQGGACCLDGSDRHFHAVITNQAYDVAVCWNGIERKAGTVEHTHDEVKNELRGNHMPVSDLGSTRPGSRLRC
jgi:hypothetical protein